MASLMECVPNFSEGSDAATIAAITEAIRGAPDVWLLDHSADPDHGRSVFTAAGLPDGVGSAAEAAIAVAVDRIDMRQHTGRHPRVGAVDVVPFVPLATTSMSDCIAAAHRLGEAVADRFGLPVYFYAQAARRPDRRVPADIRRAGFEGLATWMAVPGHQPDVGPSEPHPTAGATMVGARRMLIAFNIQLSTTDVAVARRIAAGTRERDGGLPAVQAIGIDLASQGCAQVSMNLLDHVRTPLWQVWEAVDRLARREGVSVLDSELVGLAPAAALIDVADHIGVTSGRPLEERLIEAAAFLRIRRFDPRMALELRLASQRTGI